MIDHESKTVSGADYETLLGKLYPGRLNEFGHVSMAQLRLDCIAWGASRVAAEMWTDEMMVYFLAVRCGFLRADAPPAGG